MNGARLFTEEPQQSAYYEVRIYSAIKFRNWSIYFMMVHQIRVGDTDVASGTFSASGRRICSNRLCHMTGAAQVGGKMATVFQLIITIYLFMYFFQNTATRSDCSVPLPGRYVSFQKYGQYEDDPSGGKLTWQLVLTEIDLLFLS